MIIKFLHKKTPLIKTPYKELSPTDRTTYLIYCAGLITSILIFTLNNFYGYSTPRNISIFSIITISISIHIHFNLKKYFLSSLFVITMLNFLAFYANLRVGLVSSYFMYTYVFLCAIPFLNKRTKNYLKNSVILSIITLLFAILSFAFAPQYNVKIMSIDDANNKLLTNSIISLTIFLIFSLSLVKMASNIIIALIKAKKNAEREKDTKTRVLSNLGHELRTQLSSIHGITQLLLEQNKKDELSNETLSEYTEILDVCNNQMLFLVNDILDIHKIESGNFSLNNKPENLSYLLNQVIIPFKNKTKDKNLVFEISIDDKLKNIYANIDASRLTQVIQNLLSNAIKYTEKGFVGFSAKLESETKENLYVSFFVKDSGLGIEEANLDKVFESFQQIRDNKNLNAGGTGLGLAISKTIIEKMGSKITAFSKPNMGSDFNFKLKLKKVTDKELQKSTTCHISQQLISLDNKKILITEDNKISMLYASKLLEKNKATIFKAFNGLEAVNVIEKNPDISLILLDLEMPVMNGFTAIKEIKKINKSVKIIAFTANIPDANLLERLKQLNFDGFLPKPFKNEQMFSVLKKHLN